MKKLLDHINLRKSLLYFLKEDIGIEDVTSNNLLNSNKIFDAEIIYKSDFIGILCGIEETQILFEICDCEIIYCKSDGMKILSNEKIMQIRGQAKNILKAERVALNLLMRLSGIATMTRRFVDLVNQIDSSISIASTRKTVPGLRLLDKKAVVIGGGISHRIRLDDMVMIKDNHIIVDTSIQNIISSIRSKVGFTKIIECEVKNQSEALQAIESRANIIMLDNFSLGDAQETISKIIHLGYRDRIKIEISGGINLQNVVDYAKLKPDIISIGFLTHSSPALDFSLKIIN
ncbi:MAG TPA: carboxylating nicotinate-nucleotide diphosphorylase [Nitrososphaeraceae archaeon]|jgi:nicotinate-nucleotide pyrophosphorylase (carboxylating)|nr:carboxylating nicotinate-nucleotide diphosphorylase [Nitrososphaeraceae archaeon]